MERYHRTIERRFQTGAEAHIEIDSRNGDVEVHARDIDEVRVTATIESYAESAEEAEQDVRAVEEGIRAEGQRIWLAAPARERPAFLFFGRGLKVDYHVLVPGRTRVEVRSRNGRVEISGTSDVEIENRNGSVILDKIGGSARVSSRNGRVEATDCASDVTLVSRNGNTVAARAGGNLTAETQNGNVIVEDARREARLRTQNGSLQYKGTIGGNLDLAVEGNGSIRLGVPSASRFELDAEAVRGDIKSDLEVRETASPGEPRPVVRLRTLNGSIRIEALP